MPTVAGVLATARGRTPDAEALVDGTLRLSYSELDRRVSAHANALATIGVQSGQRVLLMSANSAGFVLAYFAALRLGAIVVPVNPASAVPEVAYIASDSAASLLLVDDGGAARLAAGRAGRPACRMLELGELGQLADDADEDSPATTVEESDDALILYTSGTTGRPKGALLDHHRVIWVGVNCLLMFGQREHWRVLHTAPLYHAAQLTMVLSTGAMMSATHVIQRSFSPTGTLDLLEAERINLFFGVPTMYQLMLRDPTFPARDLGALRVAAFGAAPMPGHVVERLIAALPNVELIQACGQTEAGPGGIYSTFAEVRARPDASGRRALPNTEARVLDDHGRHVVPGEIGELMLRGETIMKGYWRRESETAEAMADGWLRTGDLARLDPGGYCTLVDRKKDMIITGGRNVYSVEVEHAIASHPAIADCAVVGCPHEEYGESIVAVVVCGRGQEVELDALRAHCEPQISRYKLPHRLLIVDAIPRNSSGKTLKHELRAAIADGQFGNPP